jgi:hypothetical protein
MDTGGYRAGVKRPRREADNSPPSSAEVKNAWSCNSALPIRLHGVMLSLKKAQGQLYLTKFSGPNFKRICAGRAVSLATLFNEPTNVVICSVCHLPFYTYDTSVFTILGAQLTSHANEFCWHGARILLPTDNFRPPTEGGGLSKLNLSQLYPQRL